MTKNVDGIAALAIIMTETKDVVINIMTNTAAKKDVVGEAIEVKVETEVAVVVGKNGKVKIMSNVDVVE